MQVWDRFFRNVQLAFHWIDKFKKIGIEINAVEQWIDYDAHSVNTMLGIYLGMAADESHKISERVKNATYVWMSRGYWCKAAPIGYVKSKVLDENKKRLCVLDNQRSEGIKLAYELIGEKGFSVARVLKHLKKEGYEFTRSSMYRIVENPFYAGLIQLPQHKDNAPKIVTGKHDQLISLDLFAKVQEQLKQKKFQKDTIYISETDVFYPLKGVLKCNVCKKNLYGFAPTGRKEKRYPYYSHPKCGVRFTAKVLNEFIETVLDEFILLENVYKEVKIKVQANVSKRMDLLARRLKKVEKEIEQNETRKKKLSLMFLDEQINKSEYDELKITIQNKLSELGTEQNRISEQLKKVDDVMIQVLETLKNLKSTYIASDTERKRMILKVLFPNGFEIVSEDERLYVSTALVNSHIETIICKTGDYTHIKIKNGIFDDKNPVELATQDEISIKEQQELKLLRMLVA